MKPRVAARPRRSVMLVVFMWILVIFTIVPEGFHYFGPAEPIPAWAQLGNGAGAAAAAATALAMPTEGSPLSRTIWLVLLGFGVVTVASRWRAASKLLRETNPYLLLFVGLVALSVLWSIEPFVTFRRLIRAGTIVLDAIAFALLSNDTKIFQRTLRPILLAVMIGSIIFVMWNPGLAVEQSSQTELVGAWHGLALQKNGLGSLAGLGVILWMHAWLSRESNPMLALIGMAASGLCLIESRSSTSIMAAAFAAILLLMLLRSPRGMRRYLPYLVGSFVILLLTYSLAVLNLLPGSGLLLSPVTAITGKDMSFSGRTAIWEIINRHIALRPLLGTGYGAYWVQVPESPSMEMMARLFWYPTESHNGYLDVVNDLGYVGGACLVMYLITYVRQGLRIFKLYRAQGALFLAIIFEQMIANLSEARWFNSLCNEFVIMTIATMAMASVLLQAKLTGQATPVRAQTAAPSPATPRFAVPRRR
jgi:exopolysaccharide production protein ExoQ